MRRSRLSDYVDYVDPVEPSSPAPPAAEAVPADGRTDPARAYVEARQREFSAWLEAFRDTRVLVPRTADGWLTADFGGVRWVLAFSGEPELARYALARGEGDREWAYERVLGAHLLDVAVPAAGVPCGVALDAADGDQEAVLLPPVKGIVPDAAAVDAGAFGGSDEDDGGRR